MKRILSILLSLSLTFSQGYFPAVVLAQEATEAAVEASLSTPLEASQSAETEPTTSPEPEATPEASPSPSPTPSPTTVSRAPFTASKKVKPESQAWVKGEILVKFSGNNVDAEAFARSQGLELREKLKSANIAVFLTRNDQAVPSLIEKLKEDGKVAWAERNFKRQFSTLNVNDPGKDELWALDNQGQTIEGQAGTFDTDIDIPEAWEISEGSASTLVAVIDTGIAYNHPDLTASLWNGATCKDENGGILGDCLYGYDFHDNDKDPSPNYGYWGSEASHGTHIAGTIAAIKNNNKGIVGIAPNVRVMSLKSDLSVSSLVRATDFARVNGAKVINASYGGAGYSQAEREAIERFAAAGGLFIAAAGNWTVDLDRETFYPASLPVDGIISVAATDNQDNIASFSNYGAKSVDVGAPGVDIYSTIADFVIEALISQDFEDLTPPALPTGWTADTGWQTVATGNPEWGNVLYPEPGLSYLSNANTKITSGTHDLSGKQSAEIEFWARCDTEYDEKLAYTDYLELQVSGNGQDFTTIKRVDEIDVDDDSDESNNLTPPSKLIKTFVPYNEITSNFQFRFLWFTNDVDNNHEGCAVDDIKIGQTVLGNGENYEHWSGTSMATPHVTATAALVWSANSNLTGAQVKSIILGSGDATPALVGKTLTGKRINAARALQAVGGVETEIFGLADDPSPVKSKNWKWYTLDQTAEFRWAIDQNPTGVPTGPYSPVKSATKDFGDGKFYLHVQAMIGGIESEVVTVYAVLDNTVPSVGQIPISAPHGAPPVPISSSTNDPFVSITWEIVGDVSGVVHYLIELVNKTTNEVIETTSTVFGDIVAWLWDGLWNILVTAEDNAGNKAVVLSESVLVDTLAPLGTLTEPEDESYHNTLPDIAVDIEEDATGSAVQHVNFWFEIAGSGCVTGGGGCVTGGGSGGTSTGGIIATDYEAPYEATAEDWAAFKDFLVSPAPEGLYSIWAEVVDTAGNRGLTPGRSFTYDTTEPAQPVVTSPAAAITVNADIYKIEGEKEPGSLARVYLGDTIIAEETLSKCEGLQGGGCVAGGGATTFALTVSLAQGVANNFKVALVDFAGNESERVAVPTITEDSSQPVITNYTIDNVVISPKVSPGVKDTATITLEFSEEVTFNIHMLDANGNVIRELLSNVWDGRDKFGAFVADGLYTVEVIAIDTVGNSVTDISKTITVDNDTLTLNPIGAKQVNEGEQLTINLVSSDEEGNSLTFGVSNAPSVSAFSPASGQFLWTPSEAQGPGTFNVTFSVTNGSQTLSEEVAITVNEVNQAPVVENVTLNTNEDTGLNITLASSDADLPANSLTYSLVSTPTNGTLGALAGDQVVYTPNANFSGTDSFMFKVSDGFAAATAVISITVNPVNDAPTAVSDTFTTIENTTIVVPQATLLVNDTDVEGSNVSFVTAGQAVNGAVTVNGTNVEFTPNSGFVGLGSFVYTITDGTDTAKGTVKIVVNPAIAGDQVILEPVTDVTPTTPDIVVGPSEENAVVNIPANVTNAVLDLFAGLGETIVGSQIEVTIPADITLNVASTAGTIVIKMPQDITVSAPAGWNGKITAPKLESNTSVAVTAPLNKVNTTTAVIEVGAGDTALTFNKAVRIVMPGQTGKLAAWVRSGVITEIANTCSADTQVAGDALGTGAECKVDSGADLVIWTKHFTQFVAYTQTAQVAQAPGSSSGSSGSSSGGGAPVCGDTKPASAPKLLSAQVTGSGKVTLTWSPASEPVSYYLVAYGNKPGEVKYGNPNVGGKDATIYTVGGLGGGTYYFRVRAGNGCTPGDFSNEMAASFGGVQLTAGSEQPAEGFIEGVLGETADTETESGDSGEVKAEDIMTETEDESLLTQLASNKLIWALAALVFVAGIGTYFLIRPRQ